MKMIKLVIGLIFFLLLSACTVKEQNTEREKITSKKTRLPSKRLEEQRRVDENNPPIKIDIISARKTVKDFKCSQIANKIHYVKLSHPFDEKFLERTKVQLTPYDILVKTQKGIALFDRNGNFREMICRDGKIFEKSKEGYYYSTAELKKQYVGSVGEPIAVKEKIYYKYVDIPKKTGKIIEYIPREKKGLEEEAKIDTLTKKYKGFSILDVKAEFQSYSNAIIPVEANYYLEIEDKSAAIQSGVLGALRLWQGDTICQFKDYDRDFTIPRTYRNAEHTICSNSKEDLLIRQCYNDTIFKLVPPNKLQPKYILDFGEKGIHSAQEGMSPAVSLKERFVVDDIKEIKDYLFVFYTQNYDCPNTARDGTLKYNLYVFDKKAQVGYHIYTDAKPYLPPLPKDSPMPSSWPQAPLNDMTNTIGEEIISLSTIKQNFAGQIYAVFRAKNLKNKHKYADNDIIIAIFE